MGQTIYPENYLLFNQKLTKNMAVVLRIDGVPYVFGVAEVYSDVVYGQAGLTFGLPGLVYGAAGSYSQILPFLQLDSDLVIQQRIEPETGRGNIGNLVLSLVDVGGLVSKIVSPGQYVDEIMGELCTVYIGFTDTSFPQDYVILYRGSITQVQCPPGVVKLTISDSTNKSRQPIFDLGTATLAEPIPATGSSLTVTMDNTGILHQPIPGPDGTYDPTVQYYFEIDDEIFEYAYNGIVNGTTVNCTRGQFGSTASEHDEGATITPSIGFGQNNETDTLQAGIHGIDWELKLLLSGWDGPCITDVPLLSIGQDQFGNASGGCIFMASTGFVFNDAYNDLGLSVGDWLYITGASATGNNYPISGGGGQILGIIEDFYGNNTILQTNLTFTPEYPTSAVVAFRSQYDTLPLSAGLAASTKEVDVSTFQSVKAAYFSTDIAYLRSYYNAPIMGLDLISSDIMLTLGCYGISRHGRISMAVTKPPLPGTGQNLVQLDYTNILDPDKIVVTRATNQRSFYNEISYEYDYNPNPAVAAFENIQYFLDTDSMNAFNDTEILPIQSMSASSELAGDLLAQQRGAALLERFSQCLTWIELTVNWKAGSLIEVSDIVVLVDNGKLQIMNFATGERNIGVQLFEVIDRTYNVVSGNVKLKLLGGLGFGINSRFGLITPSTILGSGCTSTKLILTPSYGQTTLSAEIAKWTPLIGAPILVHDVAWSVTGTARILQTDPSNPYALDLQSSLGFAPTAGMILDLAPYNYLSATASVDLLIKQLYAFITPTILITSGISQTQFTIASSGAGLLTKGNWVVVRDSLYENYSPQSVITAVSGDTITVATTLGFVPASGYYMEGVGFTDETNAYLYD